MRVRRVAATTLVGSVATVFGFALFAPGASVLAGPAAEHAVRDDDVREVAVVQAADDDDDDSNSKSRSKGSGVSRDHTNSRFSKVSRNRDKSRGDLTRDLTRDGKGKKLKRDWSDNRTNDRSRNDSRASRKTRDHTRSNYSKVSRDRDKSRGDLTRDLTRDGKGKKLKRDWSDNRTNDRSRNDTR